MTDNLPAFTVIHSPGEGHFIKGEDGHWYEIFTMAFDEEQLEKCYKFMPGLDPKPREDDFLKGKNVVSVALSGDGLGDLPDAADLSDLLGLTDENFGSRAAKDEAHFDEIQGHTPIFQTTDEWTGPENEH